MYEEVLSIHKERGMSHTLNSTFVALIPKRCTAEYVSDYIPISLCNFLYKLTFKIITNILKPMMYFIIFSN